MLLIALLFLALPATAQERKEVDLALVLAIGLVANALVRPLPEKWFMSDAEVAALQAKTAAASAGPTGSFGIGRGGLDAKAAFAWIAVGIPLLWGVWVTVRSSLALFG